MKLSTKTRYGTRALLDLAIHYGSGPISSAEIAERQEVSRKYLETLLASLRAAGLIRSVSGARGGHELSRPPDQISLREIFEALEGTDGFVQCTAHPEVCARSDACVTIKIWRRMYDASMDVLQSTTLAELRHLADGQEGGPNRGPGRLPALSR